MDANNDNSKAINELTEPAIVSYKIESIAEPLLIKPLVKLLEPVQASQVKKASVPRKLDKQQFGLCRICHDKATGIHYGVSTCEGCKGFYKRSVLRKRVYKCCHNNKCEITVENRKNCKSCRYSKCLRMGMCLEGIFILNTIKNQLISFLKKFYIHFSKGIKMGRLSKNDKRKLQKSNGKIKFYFFSKLH